MYKSISAVSFLLVAFLLFMAGCTAQNRSTLGDGVFDHAEQSKVQLAVGLTMGTLPETVAPAYAVSSALLASKDIDLTGIVEVSDLEGVVKKEVDKLNLDPYTLATMNDFMVSIKANLDMQFDVPGITKEQKYVIFWQFVSIVNRSAKARIGFAT